MWVALSAALAIVAGLGWRLPPEGLDWQPALALSQPWRAWSAVFVHYSGLHLAANLAGSALVGALGQAVPVPRRCVVAWLAAWPLTQFGLLTQPALLHYGGLSGVLHAGVAVVCVHLCSAGQRTQRHIGMALAAGLVLKLIADAPWEGVWSHPAGWDIAVAPMAHVSGTLAGAACAMVGEALARRRAGRRLPSS